MIKNLHIQNYRSIRDMSLELEQLNIVFGPNGTGKSNIYKAIYLMHLSLIHISEPTRQPATSRMPSSA